jgi:deoxycytidylate deaminase
MHLSDHIIDIALKQAQKSNVRTGKFGAVLVHRNKIISVGYNDYKRDSLRINKSCLL